MTNRTMKSPETLTETGLGSWMHLGGPMRRYARENSEDFCSPLSLWTLSEFNEPPEVGGLQGKRTA